MYVMIYCDICYKLIHYNIIVLQNNRSHVKDPTVTVTTTEMFQWIQRKCWFNQKCKRVVLGWIPWFLSVNWMSSCLSCFHLELYLFFLLPVSQATAYCIRATLNFSLFPKGTRPLYLCTGFSLAKNAFAGCVSGSDPKTKVPGFKTQISLTLASFLISLCLGFPICNMGIIVIWVS